MAQQGTITWRRATLERPNAREGPGELERVSDDLYAALLKSGRISPVPTWAAIEESGRPLLPISGELLSETVIRDRR